jgi:hypothetical protein
MTEHLLFCPKCGANNTDDATFCASCGSSLKADSTSTPSPVSSPSQPSAPISAPTMTSMSGVFKDAIALVKDPKGFMTARADAAPPVMETITKYVAILALIPFVFTLLGDLVFIRNGNTFVYAIVAGIVAYIFALVSVVVVGFILWKLAPNFSSVADQNKATKLVSWVYTPVFLIAILNIIPGLAVLSLVGLLYGLYILYIGLPIVLKTPTDKVIGYVVVTLVVTFIVYFVLSVIGAALSVL